MNMEEVIKYKDQAIALAMVYVPKVLLALLTLIIGLWLIGGVRTVVGKALSRTRVDKTLAPFVLSLLVWGLKAALFIGVASMIGVETTSFAAILGAAGLAVGLALQGSLSNFAGGVLTLIFRPYEVGHVIEAQGHTGTVKEIQSFTTVLLPPQNRRVILSNGALSNGPIVNHSVEGTARVDLTIPHRIQSGPRPGPQDLARSARGRRTRARRSRPRRAGVVARRYGNSCGAAALQGTGLLGGVLRHPGTRQGPSRAGRHWHSIFGARSARRTEEVGMTFGTFTDFSRLYLMIQEHA